MIRVMTIEDYDEVYKLWKKIRGFGIRSIDDSKVDEAYRRHGIGKDMVVHSMKALQEEKINKVCLIAFAQNNVGNAFWNTIGWTERLDVNYYDFILNDENITKFNE